MSNFLARRKNLLQTGKDHWIPPVHSHGRTFGQRAKLFLYRYFDLQFSTIENDLAAVIPQVRGSVLDAGCGIQPFRHMFSSSVLYTGLDSVDSKSHFGYEAPDTLYYSGNTWPVKNESSDFILCTETLEHIPEPILFLKEAYRALKPDGQILLTVPFAARWHFIPYDYWRYTPSGLENILKKAGFSDIQVFARGNELTVACYKLMSLIFTLLFPIVQNSVLKWLARLLGFLLIPLLLMTATVAQLTKNREGSVDCLGYTILAKKPSLSSMGDI